MNDRQHRDTKPCEKCGSANHGTGAHEKLVQLELEDLERRVDDALAVDQLARLELVRLTLELEWAGEEADELGLEELRERAERLRKAIKGELGE